MADVRHKKTAAQRPDYASYEREKAEWVRSHPTAGPREYESAMREIARRWGV